MTLGEVFEEMKDFLEQNPEASEMEFYAHVDYGDHCHTEQLVRIEGELMMVQPKESAYSESGLALPRDPEPIDHIQVPDDAIVTFV